MGDYVVANETAALAYAQRASDLGASAGLTVLGFMHATGTGVPRDEAKALSPAARLTGGRPVASRAHVAGGGRPGAGVLHDGSRGP
jgi:hypothetical protein